MFMDQNDQYSENEYTTQSNLQIQCNPYQATNGIFHRTRTNSFTVCKEIQKTWNSPKPPCKRRMELEESTYLTSGSTTKLQSSKQYGTGTEAEIHIKGTKQKAQRETHAPMDNLYLTKEGRVDNGEKTTSIRRGARKNGQPLVKE